MAEQPPSGNSGERLDLKIGGQSIGLTSRDLIPVLLLLAGGLCGYLVYLALDQRLLQMREVQVHMMNTLQSNRETTSQEYHAMRELHTVQIDYFRKLLLLHDANQGRAPEERWPLDFDPGIVPKKAPP